METNWGMSFIVPGIICIGVGIIVFIFLIPKPNSVGLHVDFSPDENEETPEHGKSLKEPTHHIESIESPSSNSSKQSLEHHVVEHGEQAITIWSALRIPVRLNFRPFSTVIIIHMHFYLRALSSFPRVYSLPNWSAIRSSSGCHCTSTRRVCVQASPNCGPQQINPSNCRSPLIVLFGILIDYVRHWRLLRFHCGWLHG